MYVAASTGRNWTLFASLVLAPNTLVNLGLATSTPNRATVAATFTDVRAQKTDLSQGDVVVEKVLRNGERFISHDLYSSNSGRLISEGNADVTFSKTALIDTANVKLTISKVPATDYPDDEYFARNYPVGEISYLGPLVTTEVPLNVLDWEAAEEEVLMLITPSFYEGALETIETRDIFIEVRIMRPGGKLVFYTFDYGFFGEVGITNVFLQTNLLGRVPEILKISVQAVDLSQVLPDPGALPGTMPE